MGVLHERAIQRLKSHDFALTSTFDFWHLPSPDYASASDNLHPGLIVHDVSRRRKVFQVEQAHKGKVSGVCFGQQDRLLSCGVDRNIKLWSMPGGGEDEELEAGPSQVSFWW